MAKTLVVPSSPFKTQVECQKLLDAHKEASITIRNTMLGMLGLAVFTIYTVLSASDLELLFIGASSQISIPILKLTVTFYQFIIISFILLIALNAYVFVFTSYKKIELSSSKGIDEIDKIPDIVQHRWEIPSSFE
jgi:hypothetical protein